MRYCVDCERWVSVASHCLKLGHKIDWNKGSKIKEGRGTNPRSIENLKLGRKKRENKNIAV